MGKISGKPGQQHLRFCKQNLKETGRIKGSGKTFSFHVGLGTEVGVPAEVQGGLVEEVQIQWRHIFLGSGEIFLKDNI